MNKENKNRIIQVFNFETCQWSPLRTDRRAIPSLEIITPEMARLFLENNPNRKPSRDRIEKLKRDMVSGKWGIGDSSICFGEGGELFNGQNRMMALSESAMAEPFVVVFGLTKEDQAKMDGVKVRNMYDVLTLVRPSKNVARLESTMVHFLCLHTLCNVPRRATPAEEVAFFDRYRKEIRWASDILRPAGQKTREKLRPALIISADMGAAFVRAYHCFKNDPAKLQRLTSFAQGLVWKDFYLELARRKGNIALEHLVDWRDANHEKQGQTHLNERYRKVEKCILNFVESIETKNCPQNSEEELFPFDMELEAVVPELQPA